MYVVVTVGFTVTLVPPVGFETPVVGDQVNCGVVNPGVEIVTVALFPKQMVWSGAATPQATFAVPKKFMLTFCDVPL